MKHLEVLGEWKKKIEIEIFDKWLISLDHVIYRDVNIEWCKWCIDEETAYLHTYPIAE